MRLLVCLALLAAMLCGLTLTAHAAPGLTVNAKVFAVRDQGETIAPVLNLGLEKALLGLDFHVDVRHAMDRSTWSENRLMVGACKDMGPLNFSVDWERKYNACDSRLWFGVGTKFTLR